MSFRSESGRVRTDPQHFLSGLSGDDLDVFVGITVLLRDILFSPELVSYPIHLMCLTLSVWLLLMLTYFYARKNWKGYTKFNLWMIFIVDVVIAVLYHYDIAYLEAADKYTDYLLEAADKYTDYLLTEIWIRPTITYGLVTCFVTETRGEG